MLDNKLGPAARGNAVGRCNDEHETLRVAGPATARKASLSDTEPVLVDKLNIVSRVLVSSWLAKGEQ